MSQLLINAYLNQLDIIRKISGSVRETIVREACAHNTGNEAGGPVIAVRVRHECNRAIEFRG